MKPIPSHTFYIRAYGCQMNKSDAERIESVLKTIGMKRIEDETKANFVFMVACSVRQPAINSLYTVVSDLRKKRKDRFTAVLTGCLLKEDKLKLAKKYDLVFDITELEKLPEMLKNYININSEKFSPSSDYFDISPLYSLKHSVNIPIMTGCDNFCAYCVVPYTRGREKSRSVRDVLNEARAAVKSGAKFITLLGQNVNSYNPEDITNFSLRNKYKKNKFAKLLWEINEMEGLNWIFFTASHPKDIDDEIIDALSLSKMVNYFHLPLQSGDDEVLKRMNRAYTVSDYLGIIDKVKNKKQDIALGTDLIIGFCGESEAEFKNTQFIYKKIRFDISYNSKYSARKGTFAYKNYQDSVPLDIKKQRWFKLQDLMEKIAIEKNQRYVNKCVETLVNEYDPVKNICTGLSRELKTVQFASDMNLTGQMVNVAVKEAKAWVLRGEKYKKIENNNG